MQYLVRKDVLAGLLFAAIGAFALWGSRNLPIGTTAEMHAGFIPRVLAYCLIGLGGVIGATGIFDNVEPVSRGRLRPLVAILSSIVAFAYLLKVSGLFFAVIVMMLLASLAGTKLRRIELLVTMVVLLAIAIVVFRYGLRLPLPVIDGLWQ